MLRGRNYRLWNTRGAELLSAAAAAAVVFTQQIRIIGTRRVNQDFTTLH